LKINGSQFIITDFLKIKAPQAKYFSGKLVLTMMMVIYPLEQSDLKIVKI
jgi:hypothetical protein